MKKLVTLLVSVMFLFTSCSAFPENFGAGLLPNSSSSESTNSGSSSDSTGGNTNPDENSSNSCVNHTYNAVVTAPSCEVGGYTTYTCVTCNASYVGNRTSMLGHSWQEATTSAPKTCKTCGATEGEKLPVQPSEDETLYVHYIDVGQGDGILLQVGNCDIVIDGGVADQGTTMSNYLKKKGVDDVELMINTHPDADHCGGLTQVLKDFAVERVWASPLTKTTQAYKNFANAVKNEGLTMETTYVGEVFTYEMLTLTVLYNGEGTSDANDSSIVAMVQYGSFRFLFTGDISSTIEDRLAGNSSIDLTCDVLKVAHHGSRYSSSATFLNATSAKYGVICVGADNSYGHPTSAALNRLKSAGISVYRTDQKGDIVFSTNGTTMQIPDGTTVNNGSGASSASSALSLSSFANASYDTFMESYSSKQNYLFNY